ncbi:uncharacterized protein NDAI_0I00240 [Naumovozyma dairenensis CBS 421]|uniref:Uncharacterized protein n=1 Tax=Naumovozyma dairenensis (strain ATCC 10597 / BCRC 20456 / CBS 421 / NBRC 0211 / NRRL Y-12639) TaxID=1071378 RepID=G0WFN2_NAUDC|nr:hypothetical protein NDAI_0I00240 [Naumovozyma dairenensis CBS 421]CCD26593.1 hypothetical protein NDAI_0I00240 [Naumovozyma dairenensis CBS 421]
MLFLIIKGTLSENVRRLYVKDHDEKDAQSTKPAEYAFDLVCTSCREAHGSPVLINLVEKHEMPGSKGEASFIMKCKFCSKDISVNLLKFEKYLYNPDSGVEEDELEEKSIKLTRKKHGLKSLKENNNAAILQLDCRGCELTKFYPSSVMFQAELTSGNVMDCQFENGEDEWYDYDEDAGEEVSVSSFQSEIIKG